MLYIRSLCGDADSELACDPGDFVGGANIGLSLSQDQVIFIIVDGREDVRFPVEGQYRLTVAETSPPTADSVQAWFNPASGATAVELIGIQGPVEVGGIEFQYLNNAGTPTQVNGQLGPFRVGADATTSIQPDGQRAYRIETTFNRDPTQAEKPNLTRLRVSAYDEQLLTSNELEVALTPPEALNIDDECDQDNVRSVCPAGTQCFISDPLVEDAPHCHCVVRTVRSQLPVLYFAFKRYPELKRVDVREVPP